MRGRKNRSQKKSLMKKQLGGMWGDDNILYGGHFDPNAGIKDPEINKTVSNLIRDTVLNSKKRLALSAAGTVVNPVSGLAQTSGLTDRSTYFSEDFATDAIKKNKQQSWSPLVFSKMAQGLNAPSAFLNGRSRTSIINMLNKYAGQNTPSWKTWNKKISYPHLWSDVNENNESLEIKRRDYVDQLNRTRIETEFKEGRQRFLVNNSLPEDLNFGGKADVAVDVSEANTADGPSAPPPPAEPSAPPAPPSTTGGKSKKNKKVKRNRKTRKA